MIYKLRWKEYLVPIESFSNSTGAVCRTEKKLQYYIPTHQEIYEIGGEHGPRSVSRKMVPGQWFDVPTVGDGESDMEPATKFDHKVKYSGDCQHKKTISVLEDGGSIFFQCKHCGAGRGGDWIWRPLA